jgi:hypothetical protein
MPNDNLTSYCFFTVHDPAKFTNYMPLQNLQPIEYPISIIFWMNLQKVDPSLPYRFGETLKQETVMLLARSSNLLLEKIFESYIEVFAGYTLTETYRQYLKPPYYAFRIDGRIATDIRIC